MTQFLLDIDALFHPAAALCSAVLAVGALAALLILRRTLPVWARIAAGAALALAALHLGLLLWLAVGFGRAPARAPQPVPACIALSPRA